MKNEEDHDLVGWDRAWPAFCETLKDVHEAYPEWLALTRYLVGVVATDHPAPIRSSRGKVSPNILSGDTATVRKGGVLFIPIFNRSYCLGVCHRLAQEVHREAPEEAIHFLIPNGDVSDVDLDEPWIHWHSKKVLRKLVWAPRAGVRAIQACRMAVRALQSNKKISRVMPLKFNCWQVHLAKFSLVYYWEVACAKRWLKKHGVQVVVTINDIVKPAAPVVAAGNQLGLKTIVLQHGVPGPQSVPFMAKQAWIWGETSKKLLCQFGANPERLEIVGNLEIDASVYNSLEEENVQPQLLLLSQWRASSGWNEIEFQTFFETVAEAASKAEADWKLLVRLHPNEGDDVKEKIRSKIMGAGLLVEFTHEGSLIEEDVEQSSFVCAVNSSAIMHALVANLPCAFLLSERLERRVGTSLLLPHQVVRNGKGLLALLNQADPLMESAREQILAHCGKANKVAACKLIKHLLKA